MHKKTLLLALILYMISALSSYGVFSYMGKSESSSTPQTTDGSSDEETPLSTLLNIDPSEPRDQACPLNGKLYTQTEKNSWEKRRPLAVMIENTPDSRPQSGLDSADVVFEAVAEGGITRFMAMFYCDVQIADTVLAPIRSARSYYIDYASGFNRPLYVHVGGANLPGPADALGQLSEYGWTGENDLNQFSIGYPTFVRDYNRIPGKQIATEHTMVTSTEKLWKVGEEREWTNMSPDQKIGKRVVEGTDWKTGYKGWSFYDTLPTKGAGGTVSYEFWTGYDDYAVSWQYDSASNSYKRSQGGEAHTDLNNNKQIQASNVVALLTTEKGPIDEKKHMLYGTTGTGEAKIFQNGTVIEAVWTKKDRESELQFKDKKGKDIQFVPGLIWISVLSNTTKVQY